MKKASKELYALYKNWIKICQRRSKLQALYTDSVLQERKLHGELERGLLSEHLSLEELMEYVVSCSRPRSHDRNSNL